MTAKKIYLVFAAMFVLFSSTVAAKPPGGGGGGGAATLVAPHIDWVKVDYTAGFIVVGGTDLYGGGSGPTVTLAGETLTVDPTSSDSTLYLSVASPVPAVLDDVGSYYLVDTTDGGTASAWVFALLPLGYVSPPPGGGGACPCEGIWDAYFTQTSAQWVYGVADIDPYCWYEGAGSYTSTDATPRGPYIDVEYYSNGAYSWFYAGWESGPASGYCSDSGAALTQQEYEACYDYLKSNAPNTDWNNPEKSYCLW